VLGAFREIVVADFEFAGTPGNRPTPVCLVAHELHSKRWFRIWRDEFGSAPPYATGPDVLFIAFYASAELGCYRVLGWPMPERILDLFCEFRARTNGLETPAGNGLLGALAYFGLDAIGAVEKNEMRELVLRGGPWSEAEREATTTGNVARNRFAAGAVARPLHGCSRRNGARRYADRCANA